jgi:hypothetical protein
MTKIKHPKTREERRKARLLKKHVKNASKKVYISVFDTKISCEEFYHA